MFRKDSRNVYLSKAFEELPWLEHGFGTRHSSPWPDSWKRVSLRQVHSNRSFIVAGSAGCLGEADALLTDQTGYLLTVRGADCLPILILEQQRRVVAAIHAGWRGTSAGIVARAVARMVHDFGAAVQKMHAAIGPGIGRCCYEVGPEVARQFRSLFPERDDLDGNTRIDLVEANRRQLLQTGLADARIYRGAPCTSCNRKDFFSFRRAPEENGRMESVIGLRNVQG